MGLRVGGHVENRVAAGGKPSGQGSGRYVAVTSAPTVSVITISYKDLDGLKRTVDSVRAQRYGTHRAHRDRRWQR